MLPYANIAAVKIVDPIEPREFRTFGFQAATPSKKEARTPPRLAGAAT
jgi:hypothetical protein